jgi:hypothetical protein
MLQINATMSVTTQGGIKDKLLNFLAKNLCWTGSEEKVFAESRRKERTGAKTFSSEVLSSRRDPRP